jgi:hypothetical protein
MIYCGSGYDFGKVFVPAPDPDNLEKFSNNKNIAQKLAFSMSEAAYFPESCPLIFFLTFLLNFMLVQEQDPGPEPYCISVQQKVPVSAVPIPAPQH